MSECRHVGVLIDGREAGLAESERLRLEAHLDRCADCHEHATALDSVLDAVAAVPAPRLRPSQRARVIERALEGGLTDSAPAVAASGLRWWAVGLVAAAAGVAAIWGLSGEGTTAHAPGDRPVAATPAPSQPIVADSAAAPTTASTPEDVAPRTWLEREVDSRLLAAGGAVRVVEQARLRLDPARRVLELERGKLQIDVEPGGDGRAFRVETARFAVQVMGTRFSVAPDEVRVERGVVRVLSPEGDVLAERLGAGGVWRPAPEQRTRRPRVQPAPGPRPAPRQSATDWLAMARRALSEGDVAVARARILSARRADPRPVNRAEAGTLLAECAATEGKPARAIALYLEVARDFHGQPAGENAQFAAAQLAARTGAATRARALFERYLTDYPTGRFAREARARLK